MFDQAKPKAAGGGRLDGTLLSAPTGKGVLPYPVFFGVRLPLDHATWPISCVGAVHPGAPSILDLWAGHAHGIECERGQTGLPMAPNPQVFM